MDQTKYFKKNIMIFRTDKMQNNFFQEQYAI